MKKVKELILTHAKILKNGMKLCNISFTPIPFDDGTILPKAPEELLYLFAVKKIETFLEKNDLGVSFFNIKNELSWQWKKFTEADYLEFWEWLMSEDIWLIGSFMSFELFDQERILGTMLNPNFRPKKVLYSDRFRKRR